MIKLFNSTNGHKAFHCTVLPGDFPFCIGNIVVHARSELDNSTISDDTKTTFARRIFKFGAISD